MLPRRLAVEGAEGQGEGGPGGGAAGGPGAMERASKVDALRAGTDRQAFVAPREVVASAVRQVQQFHVDLARTLSHGLGLAGRAA